MRTVIKTNPQLAANLGQDQKIVIEKGDTISGYAVDEVNGHLAVSHLTIADLSYEILSTSTSVTGSRYN